MQEHLEIKDEQRPHGGKLSQRTRSLSRDLTASLVIIVMLVATLISGYSYWYQSRSLHRDALKKAEDTITRVAEILAVPIWNLDYENARLIGSVYAQNEMVQGIRIYGSRYDVIYAHEKITGAEPDILEIREILFEGRKIGRAEIDFSLVKERQSLEDQLLVSVTLILVSVVVLLAVTGILLRVFLSKPLQVLQQGIARVAKGDFSYYFSEIYQSELVEIAERFRRMSQEIEAREKALQSMNQTLQEAEEKYRGIFENAVEGIFQATPDGRVINANPALARFFGYDSVTECLNDIRDIPSAMIVSRDRIDALFDKVLKQGEVLRFEAEYKRKNGGTIWGALNARAVYDESGQPVSIEGILEDITDRKKAEEELANINRSLEQLVRHRTEDLVRKAHELEQANKRLMELDEMKSAFLSSVSHELRTPLTSILGFAKLLMRDFERAFLPMAGEDKWLQQRGMRIQENLTIITQEGERLTRLINDVLDLNKIESGRMGWRDERLDLEAVLDKAVQAVKGMFSSKENVRLRREIQPELPKVTADADKLQQVLINLLNNAAKFTDEGSVTVRAFAEDQHIRVEVVDTGMGIAEEDMSSIFEKFHQSSLNTIKDKPQGTGLGLTICREIVEHYGGKIWAISKPEEGSTFIFTLPIG